MWKTLGLKIKFDENRIYGLDILRAFAIAIVVITHSITYLSPAITQVISYLALDGVTMFFVLSGFLIGRILIKSMNSENINFYTLINFWWRRWLRTLPIYFFILSFVIFAYSYPAFTAPTYKRYFIFSQNIFTPTPGFYIEAWSLSVEEWFYLLIPLLTFIFIKYLKIKVYPTVWIVSILVILFSTAVRLERYLADFPINGVKFELLIRIQVITRLDSLMFGVIGALISFYKYDKWIIRKELKLFIGILILILNKLISIFDQNEVLGIYSTVFYLSFNSIGTLLLLPFLSEYKLNQGIFFKLVTYLSIISYSMYLINLMPVQDFIIPFINNYILNNIIHVKATKLIDLLLYYPITIFCSIYLYKFIEKPFLKYRDKTHFGVQKSIVAEHV